MAIRKAEAVWQGGLRGGKGTVSSESGLFRESAYSFGSRFVDQKDPGTNPEELIGAALAGCYAMALSADLEKAGYKPQRVHAAADVHLETVNGAPTITRIHLTVEAQVPDLDEAKLKEFAEGTRKGCPISRAIAAEKTVDAKLVK